MTAIRTKPVQRVPGQKRFTLDEYHLMISAGVLAEGSPFELLNGIVREKMPQSGPHVMTVRRTDRLLGNLAGPSYAVRSQAPVSIPDTSSEPEPDVAVAVGPELRYEYRHPEPHEVLLVVEVAVTSLPLDRGEKLAAYAAAKVPVYWVVNLAAGRVETHSSPQAGKAPGYRKSAAYARGESVPVVLGGTAIGEIAVADILGPPWGASK